MKKVTLVFLLGLIFFTIISCSEDESSPTESEPEEELIINELVTSLDSTSLKSQLISIDSASIIVSKSSTLGSTLKEGSIIVSDLGNGICRYVETISTSGDNIFATTRIARLDEIILKGEINYEATITPTMIKSIEILDESNRLIYKTSLENITIDFGEWFIGDNSSTGLEASTEFEPPKIKFAAEFNGGLIDLESYIQINNETNVSIFLNNNLNGDWKYEPKWARFRLGSIPTPIPFLVIIPTLKFAVGVSAGISTGLNVDFSYSTDIKAGINYKAGSISSIWEFNDEFDVELNHHSIGEIYPYFTCPQLGFYIEDVLGPFIQIQLGPKYQISESNNTWRHKLFGVVDSDWGGEIDILGVFKLSQSYNIFTKEYIVFDELLFSNNPPNVPSNPNPADGAVDVPTSTTLSWQCSDPDGDSLTYDVYFGTSSNPPLVSNNQSQSSYSLGNLNEGTDYFWKVKAIDDDGLSNEGNIWRFKTVTNNHSTFMKYFGGVDYDDANFVQRTRDGGFIISGVTYSLGSQNGDIFLNKLSSGGSISWQKSIDISSVDDGKYIYETNDNGFIILRRDNTSNSDTWLVKIDNLGNTSWTKYYDFDPFSLTLTNDNGYIIAGSFHQGGQKFTSLLRTDSYGEKLWMTSYEVSDWSGAYYAIQSSDGGFLLSCWANIDGQIHYYLIKTNDVGAEIWRKSFSYSFRKIIQTSDGNFAMLNTKTLFKLDSNGSLIWWLNIPEVKSATSFNETNDNGFIIVGTTEYSTSGGLDLYLLKTDLGGQVIWTKIYGGQDDDEGSHVVQTSDGGYVISGSTRSFGAGSADALIIKTDENGDL